MPRTRSSDLANNPTSMRIFEGPYFNINRRLAMCLGLWPYEMKVKKIVLRVVIMTSLAFFTIPQLISIFLHYENIDRLMLSVLTFTGLSVISLKVLGMILAEENMKAVYRSISNNWQRIQDCCEREILHKYSARARTATIVYIGFIASLAVIGSLLPVIVKISDFIRPLENSRPNMYIMEGEFFIDRETHFLLIFCADYMTILLAAMVMATVDSMYFVFVEHCCALYAIVRSRLLKLGPTSEQKSSSSDENVDSYEWLRRTIALHQEALTFTSLLKDSYSTTFLFVLIAALYIIPLDSCAIIANLDNPLHLVPYVICLVGLMAHGFFLSYPGQRLINHQLSLLDAAYCNEWYAVPLRTKKLLLTFMLRCSEPVTLTAGNLLPVNFQVFFKIIKTAASYVTALASLR